MSSMKAPSMKDWQMRQWNSFTNTANYALPPSMKEWSNRVSANLEYYKMNYLIIACLVLLVTIYIKSNYLIVLILVAATGGVLFAAPSIKVGNYPLGVLEKTVVVVLVLLFLLWVTDSWSAFYWSCFITAAVVLAHSSLYKTSIKGKISNMVSSVKQDLKDLDSVAKKGIKDLIK